jgi:hypothetical protein
MVSHGLSKILKKIHQGVHSAPAVGVPVLCVEHSQFDILQVFFNITQSIQELGSIFTLVTERIGVGGLWRRGGGSQGRWEERWGGGGRGGEGGKEGRRGGEGGGGVYPSELPRRSNHSTLQA